MVDRSSYYTTDQTPFVGQNLISNGLGYLMQRARNVQPFHKVPVRIGTRPYPGGDTGIGQAMNSGIGALRDRINNVAPFSSTPITIGPKAFPKPTKQHKEIAKAALKASEARAALDDKLASSDLGQQVKQADAQQRYEQAAQAALAQAAQPAPVAGQQPATMPQAGGFIGAPKVVSSGGIGGPPVTGLDPSQLGPPVPDIGGGISSLINAPAHSGYSYDPFSGSVTAVNDPATGAPPPKRSDAYAPAPNPLPQAPVGSAQMRLEPPGSGEMPGMTGSDLLVPQHGNLPEDRFASEPGHDPNALSNRLYGYIADHDQAGGFTGLGRDLNRVGNKAQDWIDHAVEKSGEKLEHYFSPQGPYGSGQTPFAGDLVWAGDKLQQGMDYMATVPVPGLLRDPVGTIKSLAGDGKKKGETTVDPALGFPEDALPEDVPPEGGTPEDTSTSDLDKQLEKYLSESDTSYDDALKTIDKAYGGLEQPKTDVKQDAADAYAARAADRTAALAQLAMAGGLIKSAGKSWEGAGQGVMDAAGVYSQGFDRYQKALDDSADRAYTRGQADRAFEISKRGAALTMWQSGQTDKRAMIRDLYTMSRDDKKASRAEAREDKKGNLAYIDEYHKTHIEALAKDETMDPDVKQAAMKEAYDLWAASRKSGHPVTKEELAARQARAAAAVASAANPVGVKD